MDDAIRDGSPAAALSRAEVAFRRAVQLEFDAIRHHERIAASLDVIAAGQERSASRDRASEWAAMAVRTRRRADAARQRADDARARLRREGVL